MWYLLFLYIIPTFALDYEVYKTFSPKLYLEYSTEYKPFFPIRDNRINFKVKARSNAKVILTTGPHYSQPMFEFLIGSYENTYLYLRKNNDHNSDTYLYTYNILNATAYCGFWIQLDYENDIITHDVFGYKSFKSLLRISFGHEHHVEALITKDEVNPENYKFFGIGSWGDEAYFEIPDIHPLIPPRTRRVAVTEYKSYPTYKQFVHVTQRTIRFKVKSGPEVWIALAPTDKADNNFFEMTFRKNETIHFYNHVTKLSKYYVAANLLSASEFHRFWLRLALNQNNQLNTSKIELGRDDEERPFIICDDTEPLIVNYFSFASTGSYGTWIIDETNEPPTFEGRTYVETVNNMRIFHEKFFKVSNNFLRLQFRGRQASIVLTAEAYKLQPMYQFIISPNKDRRVLFKSNDRNITVGILPKHFIDDDYQNFWIKFKSIKTNLQKGNRMEIYFGYENDEMPIIETILIENLFEVKYFSLATFGDRGSGYWIVEDSSIPEEDVVVVKRLITVPSPTEIYLDYPVYSNVVTFRVKAKEDTSIYLLSDSNILNYIEIQIGYEKNTVNRIVKNNSRQFISEQHLLDDTEYRGFWIKFSNVTNNTEQLIRVGHEGFIAPFMAWIDPDYYAIKRFGISTHRNRGNWIIKTKKKKPNQIIIDDDLYTSGYSDPTFFIATTQYVEFKVLAAANAQVILRSEDEGIFAMIRVIIGDNQNTKCIIVHNGLEKATLSYGLLNPLQLRAFWIEWIFSENKDLTNFTLRFGQQGSDKALMEYSDYPINYAIKYVGFNTYDNLNGTWYIDHVNRTNSSNTIGIPEEKDCYMIISPVTDENDFIYNEPEDDYR